MGHIFPDKEKFRNHSLLVKKQISQVMSGDFCNRIRQGSVDIYVEILQRSSMSISFL